MVHTQKVLLTCLPLFAVVVIGFSLLVPSIAQQGTAASQAVKDGHSQQVYKSNVNSQNAYASFYDEDEEEGIETFAGIYVSKSSIAEHSIACLYLYKQQEYGRFDEETGDWYPREIFFFDGCSDKLGNEFTMKGRYATATLAPVSVSGNDYFEGNDVTLLMDASWVGIGEVHSGTDRYLFKNDDFTEKYTSQGTYRSASATINIELPGGESISLQSGEDDEALISKNRSTEMIRERY